jgi:hypothetical protein
MEERDAKPSDVRAALLSATAALAQERGSWRVTGGCDRVGDDLTLIIDLMADVIVITLF